MKIQVKHLEENSTELTKAKTKLGVMKTRLDEAERRWNRSKQEKEARSILSTKIKEYEREVEHTSHRLGEITKLLVHIILYQIQ